MLLFVLECSFSGSKFSLARFFMNSIIDIMLDISICIASKLMYVRAKNVILYWSLKIWPASSKNHEKNPFFTENMDIALLFPPQIARSNFLGSKL